MLLSALLAANISACNFDSKGDIDNPSETVDSTKPKVEETDEKPTESEARSEIKEPQEAPDFYNGVWSNSKVTYLFNQNNEFILHMADWDEDHLVTSLSNEDVNAAKYCAAAACVNNERAFFALTRFCEHKITVISFEKSSKSETVVNLDVEECIYEVSGAFINEKIGYLFAFKEVHEGHPMGGSKLSNLFRTEDGGKTWNSIDVQNVPSIALRNPIKFTKMISEDVGLISGKIGSADYDFCERTLLTTDGGLNWGFVNIPELPQGDDLHWAEVSDFTLVDASYILTIRYKISEADDACAKYKLVDQNTWVRIS